MMIMAAFMPIVGLLSTSVSYTVSFWVFAAVVFVAFVVLLAYIRARHLLAPPRPAGAGVSGPGTHGHLQSSGGIPRRSRVTSG
jgi:hypothetical protein